MKKIYSGIESSGKSLKLGMVAGKIAYRNAKWKKQTGITRPIVSNLKFSDDFYFHVTKELGIPIGYWETLNELLTCHDCDVICDEVGNYFDARGWQDLSLDVRRWLTQGAKMGIEFYGSAQDFAQVDKAFRRLCNELYLITKVIGSPRPSATRPPVKNIWGLCMVQELDPNSYNEDKKKFVGTFNIPSFFFIQRKYCEIFDTGQQIKRGRGVPLKHEERFCEQPNCDFHKVVHL